MAVITRAYSETDGNIAYASSINKVIDDLYTLQNGNINSANLGTSVIGKSNLTDLAITGSKIATTAQISYEKFGSSSIWVAQRLFLEGF